MTVEVPKTSPFRKINVLYYRRKKTKPIMGLTLCHPVFVRLEMTCEHQEIVTILNTLTQEQSKNETITKTEILEDSQSFEDSLEMEEPE